jgi:hypothetical protein
MDIRAHLNDYYSTKYEQKKNNHFREYMTNNNDSKISTIDIMKKAAIDELRIKPRVEAKEYKPKELVMYKSNYLDNDIYTTEEDPLYVNPWSPVQKGLYNFRDPGVGINIQRKQDEPLLSTERDINITPSYLNRPITNKRLQDLNTITTYASNFINTTGIDHHQLDEPISYLNYLKSDNKYEHNNIEPPSSQRYDNQFEVEHPEYFRYLKERASQRKQEEMAMSKRGGYSELYHKEQPMNNTQRSNDDGVFTFKNRGSYNYERSRLDEERNISTAFNHNDINRPDFIYNKPIGNF